MKQVWLINHYAKGPGEAGGTRHFEIAKTLRSHDWQMIIVASGTEYVAGGSRLRGHEKTRVELHDDVAFVWLRTPSYSGNGVGRIWNMVVFALRVMKLALRRPNQIARPDVVIGSTVHPAAAFAGWVLALRFRVPFIFEIRDLWPETLIAMGALKKRSLQSRVMYALEKWLLRRASAVVALLPGIREYVEARGESGDKVVWIPNGVVAQRNINPEADISRNNADNKWPFTFMYFGAFGNANDLWTLVDAYHIFQTANPDSAAGLRMVGNGPLKPELEKHAESLGLQRISFQPPVSKSEIPELAQKADAFLITVRNLPELYRYGISMNKLFDYMAAGKPTLIANCSINDPIRDSGGGISVPSGEPKALAAAMKRIVDMPTDEREKMGSDAVQYVRKHHSFPVLAEKLAKTLNNVIAGVQN